MSMWKSTAALWLNRLSTNGSGRIPGSSERGSRSVHSPLWTSGWPTSEALTDTRTSVRQEVC